MDETTEVDGSKTRSQVKWFTFVFAAALVFLGVKLMLYARSPSGFDPEKTDPVQVEQFLWFVRQLSLVSLALGGLSFVVALLGSVARAPWVKLVDLGLGVAFVAAGGYILALQLTGRAGGVSGVALPIVIIIIGVVQGAVALKERRRASPR